MVNSRLNIQIESETFENIIEIILDRKMDSENFENMFKIMRENNLEFVGNISSDLRCIICKNVLIDACHAPCGCRFCMECIKDHLKDGKGKCPGQSECCDIELIGMETDIHIVRVFNKRISRLAVKCPNVGCQSQVELSMIADHLRICENQPQQCPYSTVGCAEEKLAGDKMMNHLSVENFSHTRLLLNWMSNSRNEIESLRKDVEQLRADNDELKDKMRIDGERRNVIIGDLKKRERENVTEIEMLGDEMMALKNSNRFLVEELQAVKENQTEQISQLKTQVENQREEIEQLIHKCEMTEARCDEIRQEAQKSQGVQVKLDEISQANAAVKAELKETNQSMQNMKMATADLAEKFGEMQGVIGMRNRGEFEWKINNWAEIEKNLNRILIYSDSFASHPNGYKMCLIMRPGWDDNLYFCFCIMKGDFDHLLRWPFDGHVEISLINQQTGLPHRTWTAKCAAHPHKTELQKPKNEKNLPYYYSNSITFKEISENPELLQKNQIVLKCSVKPADNQ